MATRRALAQSGPVSLRLQAIQNLLHDMQAARQQQGVLPGYHGAKHGVWLSMQLWNCVQAQLKMQMRELAELEKLLLDTHEELMGTQATNNELECALQALQEEANSQRAGLERHVASLEAQLSDAERQWQHNKQQLGAQVNTLLGDLHARDYVLQDNDALTGRLKEASRQAEALRAAADDACSHAAELQQRVDSLESQKLSAATERDLLLKQVRQLCSQLSNAQEQLHLQQQATAARRHPSQQLMDEAARLRDDNRRLVALLGETAEWKQLAKRMQDEEGALRYVPVHEVLLHKGGVSNTYPPLDDRPLKLKCSGAVPEEWHWVPQEAVDAVLEAVARAMPGAPLEPLLGMLLSLNKIWRRREAKANAKQRCAFEEEMRELHRLYRQRAPYEAVVGKTQLCHLKRQLRTQAAHAHHLSEKAKGQQATDHDDNKVLLQLGLESIHTMSKRVSTLKKKTVRLRKRLAAKEAEPPVCNTCLDNLLQQTAPQLVAQRTPPQLPIYQADVMPSAVINHRIHAVHSSPMAAGPSYMQRPASPAGSGFVSTAPQHPSLPGLSSTTYQILQIPSRPASSLRGSPVSSPITNSPAHDRDLQAHGSPVPSKSAKGGKKQTAAVPVALSASSMISAAWPGGATDPVGHAAIPAAITSPSSMTSHGEHQVAAGPVSTKLKGITRSRGSRSSAGLARRQPTLTYSMWDTSGALTKQGNVRGLA